MNFIIENCGPGIFNFFGNWLFMGHCLVDCSEVIRHAGHFLLLFDGQLVCILGMQRLSLWCGDRALHSLKALIRSLSFLASKSNKLGGFWGGMKIYNPYLGQGFNISLFLGFNKNCFQIKVQYRSFRKTGSYDWYDLNSWRKLLSLWNISALKWGRW